MCHARLSLSTSEFLGDYIPYAKYFLYDTRYCSHYQRLRYSASTGWALYRLVEFCSVSWWYAVLVYDVLWRRWVRLLILDTFLRWPFMSNLDRPFQKSSLCKLAGLEHHCVPVAHWSILVMSDSRACNLIAQVSVRGGSVMFSSGDGGVGAGTCLTNDGTNRTIFQPVRGQWLLLLTLTLISCLPFS